MVIFISSFIIGLMARYVMAITFNTSSLFGRIDLMIILLFLFYEHIKNNPKDAVLKIAKFLGEEFVVELKENND